MKIKPRSFKEQLKYHEKITNERINDPINNYCFTCNNRGVLRESELYGKTKNNLIICPECRGKRTCKLNFHKRLGLK